MNLPECLRLLQSKTTAERIGATQWIAKMADTEDQEILLTILEQRSGYEASLVAEALGRVGDDLAMRRMVTRFAWYSSDGKRRDPGCHIRSNLAYGFAKQKFLGAVSVLRVGIRTVQMEPVGGVPFDTGAHLRANCALALGQMRAPDAVRDISLLLFEGDDPFHNRVEMRKSAAQALAMTCDPNASIPLTIRLYSPQDETPEVLQECMQSLVALEDPRTVETLSRYVDYADRALAAFACVMIAETRHEDAAKILFEAIPKFSREPLQAVVLALASMRTDDSRTYLLRLEEAWEEQVRLALVEVLRGMEGEAERACLTQLAEQDSSARVRKLAKEVLLG